MRKKHTRFKYNAETHSIVFSDGTAVKSPPPKKADREALLAKITAIKRPICSDCGGTKLPVLRSSGAPVFICAECNAAKTLKASYRKLTSAELEDKIGEAHRSHQRKLRVIQEIQLERMAR